MVSAEKKTKKWKKSKYPSKRGINLLYRDSHTGETVFTVAVFVLFMIFLGFFSHYYVAVPLGRADAAEAKYAAKEAELSQLREANSIYAKVRAEYSHYGNGYLNEEERARQDRITMLNIIDSRLSDLGGAQSISIAENVANITIDLEDGNQLSAILASLEESEYVSFVTASTAATVDRNANYNESNPYSYITAQITVYFRSPAEVTAALEDGVKPKDSSLDAMKNAVGDHAYVPEIHERPTQAETGAAVSESRSSSTATGSRRTVAAQSGFSGRVPETAAASQEGRTQETIAETRPVVPTPTQKPIPTKSANVQTPSIESTEITSLNQGYSPR